MGDEFIERRERYYLPKRKVEGGKLERFVTKPVMRVFNMTKPPKDKKKERAEA